MGLCVCVLRVPLKIIVLKGNQGQPKSWGTPNLTPTHFPQVPQPNIPVAAISIQSNAISVVEGWLLGFLLSPRPSAKESQLVVS